MYNIHDGLFEVGDRVIRTYKGNVRKGIVVEFEFGNTNHLMVKSLEEDNTHWNINEEITRDVQYWTELST